VQSTLAVQHVVQHRKLGFDYTVGHVLSLSMLSAVQRTLAGGVNVIHDRHDKLSTAELYRIAGTCSALVSYIGLLALAVPL
jgi:hypothetical protein